VVKHVGAVELRIAVVVILAAAADAVLVAHHLLKPGAHLVSTARPVEEKAWRQEARGRKRRAGKGLETLSQQVINNSAAVQQDIFICIQWQVNPRGDVPLASWDQWP
jgi:hypothetical protein